MQSPEPRSSNPGTGPADVLARCQRHLPDWRQLDEDDFDFAPPRGFSTFTMAVRCRRDNVEPRAVLYRHLHGKENAILDFEDERRVYLALAGRGIAAQCYAYEDDYRLEAFYEGRTLTRHDLANPDILRRIGAQLAKLHRVSPRLPAESFFERVHRRWGRAARDVIVERRDAFPENEQAMCDDLVSLVDEDTLEMVRRCLPEEPLTFCHNDTYQGNVMLLDDGEVRLLDFEFSCLNHRAFDFANLFAETVTRHGLSEYPYFDIAEPEYSPEHIAAVVDGYMQEWEPAGLDASRLSAQTESMILLSDYMYAIAALPLALEPVQKIRFIPYSLRRYRRFVSAWHRRFG